MPVRKIVNYAMAASMLINVLIVIVVATSCGGRNGGDDDDYGDKPTTHDPGTPKPDVDWLAIQPLVQKNCGGCHDGVKQKPSFDSAAAFKGSKALAKLKAGKMPPSGKIDDADKGRLIAYLERTQ